MTWPNAESDRRSASPGPRNSYTSSGCVSPTRCTMSCCKSYVAHQYCSAITSTARTQNQSLLHQTWNTRFRLFDKYGGSPRFRRRSPCPHPAGKRQTNQSPGIHIVDWECTHVCSFSASEPCTAILLDIRDHISPTPQFLWHSGIGNVVVQLHGVENLRRYHIWRREVFRATGNESFGPRGQ